MSDDLVPAPPGNSQLPMYAPDAQLQQWQEAPRGIAPTITRSPLERPIAAVRRYKWLIAAVVILSILGGIGATRLLTEQYEVQSRIMIVSESGNQDRGGPIRSGGLLQADDWTQLLKTSVVADPVVKKLALYLSPKSRGDTWIFSGFTLSDAGFYPGKYAIDIDRDSKRWLLKLAASGVPVDSGAVTDSVGRKRGFQWILPKVFQTGTGKQTVEFTVSTPRETAQKLAGRLGTQRPPQSNFIWVTLEDPNPALAAEILNTWTREYVAVAAVLKKQKLTELARTLEGQLQTARMSLTAAEDELETFKIQTIGKPSEGAAIAGGLQETRNPVMTAFFSKSVEYNEVKQDVQLLRSFISAVAKDSLPSQALLAINTVAATPATDALRAAIAEYATAQANLVPLQIKFTPEHPEVKDLLSKINTLKKDKIPQLANDVLRVLRMREVEDSTRLAAEQGNLEAIPPRTIEEGRLNRKKDAAARLFTDLQNRYAEATLAEASATPDVRILDTAIAPLAPTKNTAPRMLMMAIVGGIGAAIGLAILLDIIDGRLRYPEQATDDLGLAVAGTVPKFPKGGIDHNSTEQTFQLVESFRSLRMTVLQASRTQTVALAVSSPSPGEGKSLISANLAMSFADAGLRTVLVDGDTRRGALHEMFGLRSAPGLTDYLSGLVPLEEVVLPTSHPALMVVPAGVRRRRSPELLTSPRLVEMVDALRARHDVVIFDTPPLAAGVDGYSIASATGSLLVVLRVGKTARRMAAEKLRVFERLPVDIVGAVLNGVQLNGAYEYYGYVPGYEADDDAVETDVVKVN